MAYIYSLADTWADGATTFTAIKMSVTDTASAAGSLLMDLQVGGVSRVSVRKDGRISGDGANPYVSLSQVGGTELGWSTTRVFVGNSTISLISTGTVVAGVNSSGQFSLQNSYLGFGTSINSPDVFLFRDAANTLAQRNGVNAQAFNLYNTYTDASNYERGTVKWSSNLLLIDTEKLGTGAQRHIRIGSANTGVGLSNGTATGVYSAAVGNSGATGNYTFAAGESTASGGGSIAMGRGASAAGGNSIALGQLVQAYQANQFAFSNRWISGFGDCQMSMFVLGASTTDTAATEMSTSLGSMTRIVVRASTTWAFEITVVGRSAGGTDNAMYMYRGMIKRDAANNTTLVGAVDNYYTNETNAAWDVAVTADDTNEALKVEVTGAATTNINWAGKVILTEIGRA